MKMEKNIASNQPDTCYDIIVIGGGIQGAGVVQAAQAAGYFSLILEKSDWGSGTSSKSSKLIHGGLRYLQNAEYSLVRESLRERNLLLKNAPTLVQSNWFHIPVYKYSRYSPWKIRLALSLYWLLSGCKSNTRFKTIAKSKWCTLQGLNTEELQTVFSYQDAQTDDKKLTEAVIQSAADMGAEVQNLAEVVSAEKTNYGYLVTYKHQGKLKTVSCRFLVNATGPWVSDIVKRISPHPNSIPIEFVQGSHLVLDKKISDECFYLESPTDRRAVFVLPWKQGSLIGTTEKLFQGNPDAVTASAEEKNYLLDVLKQYFPDYTGKVSSDMAGLRVLPLDNKNTIVKRVFSQYSREVKIITDCKNLPHYAAIYGGKLTGYRATASKVIKLIETTLRARKPRGDTKTLPLVTLEKKQISLAHNNINTEIKAKYKNSEENNKKLNFGHINATLSSTSYNSFSKGRTTADRNSTSGLNPP